jgi:DedD protein
MSPVSVAPVDNSEDTEITLGTGKMLLVFFALVILCATFFGMGYSLGRNSAKATAELLPSPSTSSSPRVLPPATKAMSAPASPSEADNKPVEQQQIGGNATAGASSGSAPSSLDQAAPPAPAAPGTGYFVQVAAVSKQEDAQALVESLKGRQYEAFVADPSPDKLFHVQVGPFAEVKEAETMRTRLVNDGYNPILKK